jgi:hypothetical protein
MRANYRHTEVVVFMTKLKRKLLAAAISCLICVGTFAQKQQGDKRPPKDQNKVVVTDKKNDRPPQNNNQGNRGNNDKKGKP